MNAEVPGSTPGAGTTCKCAGTITGEAVHSPQFCYERVRIATWPAPLDSAPTILSPAPAGAAPARNDGTALGTSSDIQRIARDLGRVVVPWDENDRTKGVGGSMIWTVINDPMAAYCELRGITAPLEDNDYLEAGRFLEPGNAAWFSYRTGLTLRGDGKMTVRHPSEPWIFASPDRFVYDKDDALIGGWEGKNVSSFRTGDLGDLDDAAGYDCPDKHYYQIQWCLGVTGLRKWWYAPLVGGNRPRFDHIIEFNADLFAAFVVIARKFWFEHVLPGVAPDITASESSAAYVKARYREITRKDYPEAPEGAIELAHQYLDASEALKPIEEAKDEAGNKLKDIIGQTGAEGIMLAPSWPCSWKPDAKGARRLNLKRPKKGAL